MKWIVTSDGRVAHAVFRANDGSTVCGLSLRRAAGIVNPTDLPACASCLQEWSRLGRERAPRPAPTFDAYVPRHAIDWTRE
jgi:hypothetical protein